ADAARAGAGLGHVADIRGSAALSARGLERAVDVAAGAARPVVRAVIALLGALDDAVPAAGRVGGDGRRPEARGPQRAIGGIGSRRHHDAELGIDGHVATRAARVRIGLFAYELGVAGPGGERLVELRLDTDRAVEQLVGLRRGGRQARGWREAVADGGRRLVEGDDAIGLVRADGVGHA